MNHFHNASDRPSRFFRSLCFLGRRRFGRWGPMWGLLLLAGCGEPPEPTAEPPSNQPAAPTLASLPDEPPTEGQCVGWQKSLAMGNRVFEVEACLRNLALTDRDAAVSQASVLADWTIEEDAYSQLTPLVAALTIFPAPDALPEHLRSAGLLPNAPETDESSDDNQAQDWLTAADYLRNGGNIVWFDAETGMFPNQHDLLLDEVAALTGLKGTTFEEEPPSDYQTDEEPYWLQATLNGTLYRRQAENYGDWYDLEAVLMLLNQIAIDQGLPERFVTLPTGDQTAIIWAVDNHVLDELIEQRLIKLSPAELSMRSGKAFEESVKRALEN